MKAENYSLLITQEVRLPDGARLILRPAKPEDAAATLALSRAVWAERVWTVTETSDLTEARQAARIAAAGSRELFLVAAEVGVSPVAAEVGVGPDTDEAGAAGRLAGILTAGPYMRGRSPKVSHVLEFGMSVRADARGRGIGQAMLRYLEFWAAARGYEKLCLSVFSHNERALRLYRRMGYEEEGRRLGQFQVGGTYVDEVLMGKWISGRSATSPSAEHRS